MTTGTILSFDKEAVRKILDHIKKNPVMLPMFTHLYEEKYWKPGAIPSPEGSVEPDDVDTSKIEPYFMLVKDDGIYLMANSEVSLPGVDILNYVVYADGFGTDAEYEDIRDAVGGDDFADPLPLEWLIQAMEYPGDKVILNFTPDEIFLVDPELLNKNPKLKN